MVSSACPYAEAGWERVQPRFSARASLGVGSRGHGLHVGVDLGPQEDLPVPVSGVPRGWALPLVFPDGVSGTEQTRLPRGERMSGLVPWGVRT